MQKMCKVCLAFLVILILFSESSEARRRPDCTRFVFHPSCRGVAAKRSESEEFVLDPRSSINQEGGADHYISNGADEDFIEFSEDDFAENKRQADQASSYDLGLAAKLWPHIKKALLGRTNRGSQDVEAFAPQKRNNEAKLEKWSKVLRHLLDQQE
uniref:L11 elevenin neuropeptide n=1 Tax=Platynereis dumerilii TaxID=6359 RepID=F8UKT2_PLADU|nr:L11 elevenin neuropeptide precursor [Platynereis dumerilii]